MSSYITKPPFLKDIVPLLALFIIGDSITTIYALNTGYFYEGNPILPHIFQAHGTGALIILKICFLIPLYYVYQKTDRFYWNVTRHSVSSIGLLATTSNLYALGMLSPFLAVSGFLVVVCLAGVCL